MQLLGQLDRAPSLACLGALAVFSNSPEVRRTAIETLQGRDTREFLSR